MTAQLAPRPGRESTRRPDLRALDKPQRRSSIVPFIVMMAVVIAVGMAGMVVLATALQGQAFAVQNRQHEANVLANQVSQLEDEVATARSVQSLAVAAQNLGMRPNPYSVPMRLSDGKVIGKARAVLGNELPSMRYLTPEQAAAEVAALDKAEAARTAKKKAEAAAKKAAAAAKKAAATGANRAAAAKKTAQGGN